MKSIIDMEACVESFAEATAASQQKVKRVELCSGLDVGGLTPSQGLIEKCAALDTIETHVLIRPRTGDFNYSAIELEIIQADIRMAAKWGARGVVFGVLTEDRLLEIEANKELIQLSKSLGLEATFHRAFDVVGDPENVLNQLIELGFDRLLTSGQAETAINGIEIVRQLVQQADGKIQIMAGSGVNPGNAGELVETGVDALHFSIRKLVREERLGMGGRFEPDVEKLIGIRGAGER